MATINGTAGDDIIPSPADVVTGDDTINGGGGNDTIDGGAGNDTINGDDGDDSIYGGEGDDILTGGEGNDIIAGNAFDSHGSYIFSSLYSDTVSYLPETGTHGVIVDLGAAGGATAKDTFQNDDRLFGIANVTGTNFGDIITGDAASNNIRPVLGDDIIDGGGGLGTDEINYRSSSGAILKVEVDLTVGTAKKTHSGGDDNDQLTSIEHIRGSKGDDILVGDDGVNRIRGMEGADHIDGRGGRDIADYGRDGLFTTTLQGIDADLSQGRIIDGFGHTDTVVNIEEVWGTDLVDKIVGDAESNSLRGEGGDDQLFGGRGTDYFFGGRGNDKIYGNDLASTADATGFDQVSYYIETGANGAKVDLADRTAEDTYGDTDELHGIVNVTGSANSDVIEGDAKGNGFFGTRGADTYDGRGSGTDFISYVYDDFQSVEVQLNEGATDGFADKTFVGGGTARDQLKNLEGVTGSGGNDKITGNSVDNLLRGLGGDDEIHGRDGADRLLGEAGNDKLYGDGDADFLDGGDGDDEVHGGDGADIVHGRDGADKLYGGVGSDFLTGGRGADKIYGNDAALTADPTGRDTVTYRFEDGANGVVVDLSHNTATDTYADPDELYDIANVTGSNQNDDITGDTNANSFFGTFGVDKYDGGGSLNDFISYGSIADIQIQKVEITLAEGVVDGFAKKTIGGAIFQDEIKNIEGASGTSGNDKIIGNSDDNGLYGLSGDDELEGKGGDDTLDGGAGSGDVAIYSGDIADYKVTKDVNGNFTVEDLRATPADGTDTVSNVETLRFANGSVSLVPASSPTTPPKPPAPSEEKIAAAAEAALGDVATPGLAALKEKLASGEITFDQFVDGLIEEAQTISVPALIVANGLGGSAPDQAHFAELMTFCDAQFHSYQEMGVANPYLGPYEALGRGFAETSGFRDKYGALSQSDFIADAYRSVFGRDASQAQQDHFDDQIDYFIALYRSANIPEAESGLLARGAVFGQMFGHAVLDEPGQHQYDDAANAFLRQAITGQAGYSQPLDLT